MIKEKEKDITKMKNIITLKKQNVRRKEVAGSLQIQKNCCMRDWLHLNIPSL